MLTIYRHDLPTILPSDEAFVTPGTLAWVVGEAGMGPPPLTRLTSAGPLQQGVTDEGFQLQPRRFTVVLGMQGETPDDLGAKRERLAALLAPTDAPIELRWPAPNGGERAIRANLITFDAPSEARTGLLQRVALEFEAPNPTFYDPVGRSLSFGITANSNTLTVPLSVPFHVGSSIVDQSVTLDYPGSWRTSPTVVIAGPLTSPVVRNETTGHILDLTGTTIATGDRYTIDTRYGVATVTDLAGVNRTAALSDASDLTTFILAGTADVPDGRNTLRASGDGATEDTQIFVQYRVRYIGR